MNEEQIYQLQAYASIIARVEGNCFLIKGLAVTIVAASIAFGSNINVEENIVLYSAIFLTLMFWRLDAKFLQVGRDFRAKQEQFIKNEKLPENLIILADQSLSQDYYLMLSWSVLWFYGALVLLQTSVLIAVNM